MAFLGRCLDEFSSQVMRFGEQEEADLLHVRTGRHMDVVPRALFMEARRFGVVVKLLVDLFKVPWVLEFDDVENDFRFGRDGIDVGLYPFGQTHEFAVENQMEFVNSEIVLLDEADVGSPGVPTGRACATVGVFLRAENRDDSRFHRRYYIMDFWMAL